MNMQTFYRRLFIKPSQAHQRRILIRCGATSYYADQLLRKYETGKEILRSIPLSNEKPIASLLDEIIAPVQKLLEAGEV